VCFKTLGILEGAEFKTLSMILPPPAQSIRRGELNNRQWQRLEPLLPLQKPRVGRPSVDHRTVVNGILWILRTGAPWRDLPERYLATDLDSYQFNMKPHRKVLLK
jgi:hypothetical protein